MRLRSVLPTATLAVVLSILSAQAQDKAASGVSPQELKAKTDYCKTCHGLAAQGFRGAFPMPRLAGQQPEYLQNQLQAFIEHRRTNPVMFNVAHVLKPSMVAALATYFKDLNPKPLGGATNALVPEARRFTKKVSRAPTFRPAPPVTGRMRRAPMLFPVWQVSFLITSSRSLPIGKKKEDRTRTSQIIRRLCSPLPTTLPKRKSKPSQPM
jgi:cytochrome c553